VDEHVARARNGRCAVRHVVDHEPDRRSTAGVEHLRNRSRRGELTGQALHENCADRARLDVLSEASDRFRFQPCSSGHGAVVEMNPAISTNMVILRHNMRQSERRSISAHPKLKPAIAIGLSQARGKGAKVPRTRTRRQGS